MTMARNTPNNQRVARAPSLLRALHTLVAMHLADHQSAFFSVVWAPAGIIGFTARRRPSQRGSVLGSEQPG